MTTRERVFAALDTRCVPLPDSILLDTPCELVDEAIGPPADDYEMDARMNLVYEWATERGVRITI